MVLGRGGCDDAVEVLDFPEASESVRRGPALFDHVDGGRPPEGRGLWWEFSGGSNPLQVVDANEYWREAVGEYVWRLPRGKADFVTVTVAEQFERPRLISALRKRETFELKRRLIAEVGIAVADVTVDATESDLLRVRRRTGAATPLRMAAQRLRPPARDG